MSLKSQTAATTTTAVVSNSPSSTWVARKIADVDAKSHGDPTNHLADASRPSDMEDADAAMASREDLTTLDASTIEALATTDGTPEAPMAHAIDTKPIDHAEDHTVLDQYGEVKTNASTSRTHAHSNVIAARRKTSAAHAKSQDANANATRRRAAAMFLRSTAARRSSTLDAATMSQNGDSDARENHSTGDATTNARENGSATPHAPQVIAAAVIATVTSSADARDNAPVDANKERAAATPADFHPSNANAKRNA